MAHESNGARLRKWRIGRGLGVRAVARDLGVTHPAIIDWESDQRTPSKPWRDALDRYTEGEVPAAGWPLSEAEQHAVAAAAKVGARKAPPPPDSGPAVRKSQKRAARTSRVA